MTAKARGDDPAAAAAEAPTGGVPLRRATIVLAADVAGYGRLLADDEAATVRQLMTLRTELHEVMRRFGGRVFSTAGDTLLAEFRDPVKALQGAMVAQASLERRNRAFPINRQMRFRMGLASGEVVDRDGDLSGDGVNVALRLESLAGAGGICISRPIQDAVTGKVEVELSDIGPQTVRNSQARVHAMMVVMPPLERIPLLRPAWRAPSSRQLLLVAGILGLGLLAAVAWQRLDSVQPLVMPGPSAATKAAQEAARRAERDRAETDRLARDKAEADRLARDQAEAERLARDKAEADRLARDQAEAIRLARDKAEADRLARDQAEADRLARDKAEADRLARDQAEADRLARDQAEADRLARDKAEADRLARDKAEADRLARDKAEADRLARDKAEADRLARDKAEADRLAREKAEAERLARERSNKRPTATKAQCTEINERGILGELTPEDRAALQRGDCR